MFRAPMFFKRHLLRSIALGTLLLGVVIWLGIQVSRANSPFGALPNDQVLHFQAEKTGNRATELLEVWLDLASNEGKVVVSSADGKVRHITSQLGDTYVSYTIDANFAVIRHDVAQSTYIREQVLSYRTATERGLARTVASEHINGQPATVVQMPMDDTTISAYLDSETGLALREEAAQPGQSAQIVETKYSVLEYIPRSQVPKDAFQIDLPTDVNREEYFAANRIDPALEYAVYETTASVGELIAEFRRFSSSDGLASDGYYMIYRGDASEVQVISGLPPDSVVLNQTRTDQIPSLVESNVIQINGTKWETTTMFGPFRGSALLDGTYVTIFAPNQKAFEVVASSLKRVR